MESAGCVIDSLLGEKQLLHVQCSAFQKLLGEMRKMLSCWMGLLLPLSPDPEVSHQAKYLHQTLTECAAPITEELLKVCVLYVHEPMPMRLRRWIMQKLD